MTGTATATKPTEAKEIPEAATGPQALALPPSPSVEWLNKTLDKSQIQTLIATVAPGATPDELAVFFWTSRRRGLDPFLRQVHFVKRRRWNRELNEGNGGYEWVATHQTGIDGFRVLANRAKGPDSTRLLAGIKRGPIRDAQGALTGAWAEVYRHDWKEPARIEVRWEEYVQTDNKGMVLGLWKTKPQTMLEKCYTADTEVLTEAGFQRFDAVAARVLQVTPHGLEPVTAQPFCRTYDGPMIEHDGEHLNFCVTPNHDMLTTVGKIEAGDLYARARSRPQFFIPRCVEGSRPDIPFTDEALRLAAAYLADGYDHDGGFVIAVSRPRKVAALRALGLHKRERLARRAGDVAMTPTRSIVTRADKTEFVYAADTIGFLCGPCKVVDIAALLQLSRRQARVFVDAWIDFDGSVTAAGVRRVYSSRPIHLAAFEIAAVAAGYAVSPRRARWSDISTMPNLHVTVSARSLMGVQRWGRPYHRLEKGNPHETTSMISVPSSGPVWCVTVPSGVLVVRRRGFSMLCGNCAEASALRMALPEDLGDLYINEELDNAEHIQARTVEEPTPATSATAPKAELLDGAGGVVPTEGPTQHEAPGLFDAPADESPEADRAEKVTSLQEVVASFRTKPKPEVWRVICQQTVKVGPDDLMRADPGEVADLLAWMRTLKRAEDLATEKKALGPDEQKAVARLREITKKLPNGRKS